MKKKKVAITTGLLLVLVLFLFMGISMDLFGTKNLETISETDTEISTGTISGSEKEEEDSMPIEPLDPVDEDAPSPAAEQSHTGGDASSGVSEQGSPDNNGSSYTEVTETAGGDNSSTAEEQEHAETVVIPEEPSEEPQSEENVSSEEENETSMMTDF